MNILREQIELNVFFSIIQCLIEFSISIAQGYFIYLINQAKCGCFNFGSQASLIPPFICVFVFANLCVCVFVYLCTCVVPREALVLMLSRPNQSDPLDGLFALKICRWSNPKPGHEINPRSAFLRITKLFAASPPPSQPILRFTPAEPFLYS